MSANLARTADGWWVVTPAGLAPLAVRATTTGELLADRAALDEAVQAAQAAAAAAPDAAVPADSVELLSPVTTPARVIAQAVNYRSHATDSGFDPDRVPPAFFRKASHSITGPAGDIIRPDGVGFLDYEVELGLVMGADLPVSTTVTDASLARYVAALVVTDDISARQIQLTKTQFYESKSYPTFTPAGPWLTLVDAVDLAELDSLRLTLSVNGQVRQDSTVADSDTAGPAPGAGAPAGGWTEVCLDDGGGAACRQALTCSPGLTIIVRPDRVIAAVATRGRLPCLPWSVPAAPVPRASQMIPRPAT
jgi:2-keto-4-pentenoate hydratase/2-oxohepta-3-ene-1,7-dioic acid hydratase in catechol pathway